MAHDDNLYDCYKPPAQEFVRGEGAYLYTENGDKYLDFIAGISVNCLGHANPITCLLYTSPSPRDRG